MIFIIEGLDRTGKTTLKENIRKNFTDKKLLTFHISNIKSLSNILAESYNRAMYFKYFTLLEENHKTQDFIFDRFHLGEFVYSPVYRNYNGSYVFEYEQKILNSEVYLILLISSDLKILEKREDGNSISRGNFSFLEKEQNLFLEAFNLSRIKNKLIIDIKDKSAEEVYKEAELFLKQSF